LDGYEPSIDFIHVDLRPLQSIKNVYERKNTIAQSKGKRDLYEKYAARERSRERDFRTSSQQVLETITKLYICFQGS
jgi:putative transposase